MADIDIGVRVNGRLRRANVESHSGWMILELSGAPDARDAAIAYLAGLGCTVNRMEGDVVAG